MSDDLQGLRLQLKAALDMVDRMLAEEPQKQGETDVGLFRTRVNGTLSELGITEIHRRFSAGEIDKVIAQAMSLSVQGVNQRRKIWEGTQ